MKINQSLQKAGWHYLAFQLERFGRTDKRLLGSGDNTGRVLRVKQKLAALIHGIVPAQMLRIVPFSIVEQNNACVCKDGLRARFTELLIIISLSGDYNRQKNGILAVVSIGFSGRIVNPPGRIGMFRIRAVCGKFDGSPVDEIF